MRTRRLSVVISLHSEGRGRQPVAQEKASVSYETSGALIRSGSPTNTAVSRGRRAYRGAARGRLIGKSRKSGALSLTHLDAGRIWACVLGSHLAP